MLITNETTNQETRVTPKRVVGWTVQHSWIFLIIVAVGVAVLAMQNRYHYLSPLGLGKAYRIDKLFGGIQEFDPNAGWITAQLVSPPPSSALSMMEPPGPQVGSPAVQMNMPAAPTPTEKPTTAQLPDKGISEQPAAFSSPVTPTHVLPQAEALKEVPELSKEEKFKKFQSFFPQFGQEEFQLANDDLYPDWKANVSKSGTWDQFLTVYRDFVQWWLDAGSPLEPGFKLWKDFLASHRESDR